MNERETSSRTTHFLTDDLISQFLARLAKLDAAGRARLKRNAGRTLDEARNVYQVFFSILPLDVRGHVAEENCFLLATLFPVGTLRDRKLPASPPHNLGASLSEVRHKLLLLRKPYDPGRPISLDRRVAALLNTDREQLAFRLCQIVRFLATHEVDINWYQLLRDIQNWNADPRTVQRSWADEYFRGIAPKKANNARANDTDEPTEIEEV